MKSVCLCLIISILATGAKAAEYPAGVDPDDRLLQLGLLDVTQAPYRADPTGVKDCTQAIQRAVNEARDHALVCFFPEGTYLVSDTISCEQQVSKLDRPSTTTLQAFPVTLAYAFQLDAYCMQASDRAASVAAGRLGVPLLR
jgi:1-acyl-sn-glycerol-3-phosphate acyltransferase